MPSSVTFAVPDLFDDELIFIVSYLYGKLV